MTNQIDLSIVIVNWNVKKYLEKCLVSIFRETKNIRFEVFVIDNASQDGSAEMVRSNFPEVKLINNKKNIGFAKANNQGIKEARGEFVLLLNPDTEIIESAIEKMVKFVEENSKCGVAGCKLLNPDRTLQPSIKRFPTLFSQILILLKLHHLFPKLKPLRNYFALDFDYTQEQEVDQVMGAFFLTRKEVLDKVGFLDENYYIWFEEVDFCRRVEDAGWKVCYSPRARIVHHKSQSFSQLLSFKKQRIFNRSLLYYFRKHHSFCAYLILLSLQPLSLFLARVTQLFGRPRVLKS